MSPTEWANDAANGIKKKYKDLARGGTRSGESGDALNKAAREISELANDSNLLPEVREQLSRKAKELRARARGYNHKTQR